MIKTETQFRSRVSYCHKEPQSNEKIVSEGKANVKMHETLQETVQVSYDKMYNVDQKDTNKALRKWQSTK